MDPILLFMIFTIVALFLSLPLVFLLTRKESQSSIPSSMFPPGNTGWPIIGETLEFLNARSIPEKFIKDRMRKFSSQIFRTSLFGETFAVVCGPAGNKFLFSNENKLVTAWWPISVRKMFPFSSKSECNEESIKQRKLLPGFLKPEALRKYVGIMDAIAKRHLKENWDSQREITVLPLSKSYTFSLTCKIFMSMDDPVQLAKFADHFSVLVSGLISLPINLPGTPFNKAIKASNFIRKLLREIVKQRKIDLTEGKASPTQDILSHMLLARDDTGQFMEEYDIADKISGLLVGGHETSISVITLIVKYLAELPQVYAAVHKEQMEILKSKAPGAPLSWEDIQNMRYSWNVACEVMRLAPPIQGSFREALTDFNYNGFLIPKGSKLHWNTNTTHRNSAYFPEPEKFDPSRFEGDGPASYTYVPFGGGPRMCPGQEFARLQILVFMHNVVTKFRWETILKDEKIVMDPSPMPAKGLPVLLIPHAY